MRASVQTSSKTPSCPRCGSVDLRRQSKAYPELGFLTRLTCGTCGLWVCNCAFLLDGEIEYRGFLKEGAIPKDLPLPMKEDVVRWS